MDDDTTTGPTGEGSSSTVVDGIAAALRRWFAPATGRPHWQALWYLVVGSVWAIVMFVVTLIVAALVLGLSFAVIGLALVPPAFALVDAMVSVERHRAAWIGRVIEPRPRRDRSGNWWRSIGATLTDPERWRQVGFVVAYVVVAPMLLFVAVVPWAVLVGVGVRALLVLDGAAMVEVVAAVAFVGVAARVVGAVGAANATVVAWFLGPDPAVALAGRVEQLAAQRDEILDAVAAERRRIERDLHDGVQQQLVALGIDIGRAQAQLGDDPEAAAALLGDARATLRSAIGELRVIGRGLHPAVLEGRGLDAALSSIVAASPIPITVRMDVPEELPDDVATTAYYVISEALANVHKHADARVASIAVECVDADGTALRISVDDDGRGGADPGRGTGLSGMRARVQGVDGSMRVDSPAGGPTTIEIVLPFAAPSRPPSERAASSVVGTSSLPPPSAPAPSVPSLSSEAGR